MTNDPQQHRTNRSPGRDAQERIPIDELIQAARQMEARLRHTTEAARRQLHHDPDCASAARRGAPTEGALLSVQQFLNRESGPDGDLNRRFLNAPLLSSFTCQPRDIHQPTAHVSATLSSQDGAALLTFEVNTGSDAEPSTEAVFNLMAMIGVRFRLSNMPAPEQRRWLELVRGEVEGNTAVLWSARQWGGDHMVFIPREFDMRIYAFSPRGYEAAVRLTRPCADELLDWLGARWFPSR